MKTLTRAEEQIMHAVWHLESGLLMEVVEAMPKPQPHKNTVATILKTLVEKGFVRIESLGRTNRYHAAIPRDDYSKSSLTKIAKSYFEGSFTNVVSFLMEEKKISVTDLELLLKQLKTDKK